MIYCCGGYHRPFRTVFLLPDFMFRDRKLEVLICPNCGALVAELTQFNVKEQHYETFRPNRKKVSKFIKEVECGSWQEVKIKYATKERAGFAYGLNKEHKDCRVFQYAVDFNGEKKLVKIYG